MIGDRLAQMDFEAAGRISGARFVMERLVREYPNTALAFTLWNGALRTLSAMESSLINGTMLVQIALRQRAAALYNTLRKPPFRDGHHEGRRQRN